MKRTRFLISSLLAAGFSLPSQAQAQLVGAVSGDGPDPDAGKLFRMFSQDHEITLASHSSHRSHSSHSSHRSGYSGGHYSHTSHTSHRSGAGGYSYDPYPVSPPVPAPAPPPPRQTNPTPSPSSQAPVAAVPQSLFNSGTRASAPPPDGLPALSGRTKRFKSIVRRVQIGLLAQDFYTGDIDGHVGPGLRSALRRFQKERGLEVTGTITPATLDALMISSE